MATLAEMGTLTKKYVLTDIGDSEFDSLDGILRTAFLNEAGEIFVSSGFAGRDPQKIFEAIKADGNTSIVVTESRHLFVPISWLLRDCPPWVARICALIERIVRMGEGQWPV